MEEENKNVIKRKIARIIKKRNGLLNVNGGFCRIESFKVIDEGVARVTYCCGTSIRPGSNSGPELIDSLWDIKNINELPNSVATTDI